MFVTLVVIHVIASVSLVLIVLLQTGRGAELGAAFGGVGQATTTRGQYTFVHKVTTALAVVFMSTSLTLAFISTERPHTSILTPGSSAPAATQSPAQGAAPAQPGQATQPETPAAQPGQAAQPATAPAGGTSSSQ